MLLDASQSQLVLVDYQARLMPSILEADAVAKNAVRLGKIAKLMQVPVWGTEENPSKLGGNLPDIRALCQRTLAKMHFSATEEGLGEWLRVPAKAPQGNARSLPKHLQKPTAAEERNMIVMAGCEAHVCLIQTALDLLEDEFEVWVRLAAARTRALDYEFTIVRGETVIAVGTMTSVCVRKNPEGRMRATEVPEQVLTRLRAAAG